MVFGPISEGIRKNLKFHPLHLHLKSWIALASYPWFWSPVIDCSYPEIKGFFFGIDKEGHVGLRIAAGNTWYELATKKKISLRAWTHLAAVVEPDDKITIYINGEESASLEISGNYIPSRYATLTIGRNNNPQTWNEFQLTTTNSYFFLDGILDEVKISGRAKPEDELRAEYTSIRDMPVPALSNRETLPSGSGRIRKLWCFLYQTRLLQGMGRFMARK